MTENKRHFNLSYGMEGVVWDGKQLVKKTDAEIRYDIDCMREAGMTEIMISSYHLEEPSSFNSGTSKSNVFPTRISAQYPTRTEPIAGSTEAGIGKTAESSGKKRKTMFWEGK